MNLSLDLYSFHHIILRIYAPLSRAVYLTLGYVNTYYVYCSTYSTPFKQIANRTLREQFDLNSNPVYYRSTLLLPTGVCSVVGASFVSCLIRAVRRVLFLSSAVAERSILTKT